MRVGRIEGRGPISPCHGPCRTRDRARGRGDVSSYVGLSGGLPGHTQHVRDRRPGDSRGGETVNLGVDLLLNLTTGLHQLVQPSQSPTTVGGRCLLRRR